MEDKLGWVVLIGIVAFALYYFLDLGYLVPYIKENTLGIVIVSTWIICIIGSLKFLGKDRGIALLKNISKYFTFVFGIILVFVGIAVIVISPLGLFIGLLTVLFGVNPIISLIIPFFIYVLGAFFVGTGCYLFIKMFLKMIRE